MPRVFYTSYQQYALEYAKLLKKNLQWDPVFWYVQDDLKQQVNEHFPNALTYDFFEAIKGKMPYFLNEKELHVLDSQFLKSMAFEESVALNMMNRNTLDVSFPYQERFDLYIKLVRLSITLLEKLKPDFIIFEETPHQACDYILYQVAKKKGIKTILFETALLQRYFLPMFSFENGYTRMIEDYKNACKSETLPEFTLLQDGLEEINNKKADYSKGIPFYMINRQLEFKKLEGDSYIKRFLKYLMIPFKLLNILRFKKRFDFIINSQKPALHNYFKQKNISFEHSKLNNLEYFLGVRKIRKRKQNNLEYYNSKANKNPDLNSPYIYCPLHYQPEKSSSPWGGYYVNQLLMIQLLAKAVPRGWKIYVKEHISQYVHPESGEEYRNKEFYDSINELENVELISIEFISFDLIDHAKATASISGSVLWESVLRGKPSLAFGEGHHTCCGGCEGIFYTPDMETLRDAIAKINSGYEVDLIKVMLYLHYIEKYGYKGYSGGKAQALYSGISAIENAHLHVNAIKALLAD